MNHIGKIILIIILMSLGHCKKETESSTENKNPPPKEINNSGGFPDFSIEIELSPAAQKKLTSSKETLIVSYEFANELGPESADSIQEEVELVNKTFTNTKELKTGPEMFRKLNPEYEALVNVYSGRKSSQNNLLSCDIVQDKISVLKGKAHKIKCDLI